MRIEPGSTPFPVVEPSVNGWKVQASAVAEVVQAALTRPDRTAALKVATVPPSLTTEQVTAWAITAAVAQEHLPASGDPVTQAMLAAVVDTLDGAVLAPDATFLWTIPTGRSGDRYRLGRCGGNIGWLASDSRCWGQHGDAGQSASRGRRPADRPLRGAGPVRGLGSRS